MPARHFLLRAHQVRRWRVQQAARLQWPALVLTQVVAHLQRLAQARVQVVVRLQRTAQIQAQEAARAGMAEVPHQLLAEPHHRRHHGAVSPSHQVAPVAYGPLFHRFAVGNATNPAVRYYQAAQQQRPE